MIESLIYWILMQLFFPVTIEAQTQMGGFMMVKRDQCGLTNDLDYYFTQLA